jgi:Flp pilus assembly protein TadG
MPDMRKLDGLAILKRFERDRRGNVAMMFAFALVPIFGMIGLVIDYGRAGEARAELDAAADSAVLAITSSSTDPAKREEVAKKIMLQQLPEDLRSRVTKVKVTSEQTDSGEIIHLEYAATQKMMFDGFVPASTMPISNKVAAVTQEPAYTDITFLLDRSASMLLAAGPADRTKMEDVTSKLKGSSYPGGSASDHAETCAFACHRPAVKFESNNTTYYYGESSTEVARKNGVRLRFDVMVDAVAGILQNLHNFEEDFTKKKAVKPKDPRYTTTIVDFATDWQITQAKSKKPNDSNTKKYVGTGDLLDARSAVLQLDPYDSDDIVPKDKAKTWENGWWQWTNFRRPWDGLAGIKNDNDWPGLETLRPDKNGKASGDGLSPATRKKFVVFVTDGVRDTQSGDSYDRDVTGLTKVERDAADNGKGHYTIWDDWRMHSTISPSYCQPIKDRGVQVVVLYTRYYEIKSNWWYNNNVAPFFSSIETKLKECASPNMFITADDENQMNAAFDKILKVVNGSETRLVN